MGNYPYACILYLRIFEKYILKLNIFLYFHSDIINNIHLVYYEVRLIIFIYLNDLSYKLLIC